MIASKKHNHCLREFDKFLLILHLPCADFSAHGRHIEDERQTLGYLLVIRKWAVQSLSMIALYWFTLLVSMATKKEYT